MTGWACRRACQALLSFRSLRSFKAVPALATLLMVLAVFGGTGPAQALTVWTVAPGQNLTQALQKASDGDVVELLPGVHRAQTAVLVQRQLTLRGAAPGLDPTGPRRAVLLADGHSAEGKGLLVVRGGAVRVENIEFRGSRVPDRNGAGIRFDRGRLWVRNCFFIDNENGILTGDDSDAELTVEDSEFGQAPVGTPLPHLIYVGRIARFVLQGSHFWGGHMGHLVKSRARANEVRYNHITDSSDGRAAYELEFPNGGQAVVVGNVVSQSAHSSNAALVSFGAEGEAPGQPRAHSLLLINNTLVNNGWRPAVFVRVHDNRLLSPVQQRWVNNLFVGLGVADVVWGDLARGNFLVPASALQDPAQGDFSLRAGAWFMGWGVAPETLDGTDDRAVRSLWPVAQFSPPLGSRPLPAIKRWSPGAHQPEAGAKPQG